MSKIYSLFVFCTIFCVSLLLIFSFNCNSFNPTSTTSTTTTTTTKVYKVYVYGKWDPYGTFSYAPDVKLDGVYNDFDETKTGDMSGDAVFYNVPTGKYTASVHIKNMYGTVTAIRYSFDNYVTNSLSTALIYVDIY